MDSSLLDTDILTEIFKGRKAAVNSNAEAYLTHHGQFAISAMTRFEIVRALRHKRAAKSLSAFASMCTRMLVLPITNEVLDRAADLWVVARDGGHSSRDADLIIVATALVHSRDLVTGNTSHFQWINDLSLADWRKTPT
jgi:tRNA(fMet)-specific endonuclease VapC